MSWEGRSPLPTLIAMKLLVLYISLYQSTSLRAKILRNDSPWDKEGFRLKTSGCVEPLAGK